MKKTFLVIPAVLGLFAIGRLTSVLFAQVAGQTANTSAPAPDVDQGWPRTIVDGTTTFLLYQPQIDRWEGNQLQAYSAVEVTTAGSKDHSYGVVYFSAETAVDKTSRLVKMTQYNITKMSFPSDPDNARSYQQMLQKDFEGLARIIALDRLEANLAITKDQNVPSNRQLNNDPPRIIVSSDPALLVPVDGPAELRPVPNQSNLLRIINTRALILYDNDTRGYSLCTLGGWFVSLSLDGPWSAESQVHEGYNLTRDMLVANKAVDLLTGSASSPIKLGAVPSIYVCTTPAELLQLQGNPQFTPISDTNLLYVSNTDSDIFMDSGSKQYYVCISGRWFQSPLLNGQWSYLSGKDLPEAFSHIPQTSLKAGVLASIPGTPQAQEAVIANDIPQTAVISRKNAALTVVYDREPKFVPIEGTGLSYAVNTSTPVILADNGAYYAVDKGVWYMSVTSAGPWDAAEAVPDSIYTIPPTCPIYNVTFVRIYRSTPEEVYCGYTPGYYGTVETSDGVVDYGTGYDYPPYLGYTWIGYPTTYGFGASFGWSPLAGWSLDFGLGYGLPVYGPWNEPLNWGWRQWKSTHMVVAPNLPTKGKYVPIKHFGFGGVAGLNVYSQTGSAQIIRSSDKANATGTISRDVNTRNNVYATRDGQVYRHQTTGWQHRDGSGWRPANGVPVQQLQRQQQGRITGGQRYQNFTGGGTSAPVAPRGGGARRR